MENIECDMDDFFVKVIAISIHILLDFEEVDIVVKFFLKFQKMFFFSIWKPKIAIY